MASSKGGCGKTTVAVNLAAALAALGDDVLLCDLDPFGSASASLGRFTEGPSLGDVIFTRGRVTLAEAIRETSTARLALAPADARMVGLEEMLRREPEALRALLASVAGRFSTVVLDTAPTAGPLAVSALAVSVLAVLPCAVTVLDLERLPSALGTVAEARDRFSPSLTAAIVPNRLTPTNLSADILDQLRKAFGSAVTRTTIPQSVRIQEAPAYGVPVTTHDPHGVASVAFAALTREIKRRIPA